MKPGKKVNSSLICIGGEYNGKRMEQDYSGYTARTYQKKIGIGGTAHGLLFNIVNGIGNTEAVRLIEKYIKDKSE